MSVAADRALVWTLNLSRFSVSEQARIKALLARMESELLARLATGNVTAWGQSRATQQLAEIAALIRNAYAGAARSTQQVATEVAKVASADIAKTLAATASATTEVAKFAATVLPPEAMMRAIAGDAIVQGATQSAWWAKQAEDAAFRFSAAVRQGLVAGETNSKIISRVRDQLDISRSNAAALVQTSVQTVANDARMESFRANADVIRGVRWLATLDSKTCAYCAARDGMTWSLDGDPLDADLAFINPPLHFNDRCVLVPLTRFSSLGGGERASVDGPVDRKITFEQFLERQGPAFQAEMLGPGRAEMWRDGKITLADLTTGTGRPLTLSQLRDRHGP